MSNAVSWVSWLYETELTTLMMTTPMTDNDGQRRYGDDDKDRNDDSDETAWRWQRNLT